ncbi:hypothetical protein HY970_01010 [Candidatus Kaiserbacteria bacterium]|nr:hypothetical protein [Candidatus Kaiserbacteria bacterium]
MERLKKSAANTLKAGIIAASTFAPVYEHGPARAAEIPQGATWTEGAHKLKQSVEQDPYEVSATFVRYMDGTSQWLPVQKGQVDQVSTVFNINDRDIIEWRGDKAIDSLCSIHTHPQYSVGHVFGLKEPEKRYAPPSRIDVDVGEWLFYQHIYRMHGVKPGRVFSAVFDARGVWYNRAASPMELKEAPQYLKILREQNDAVAQFNLLRGRIENILSNVPQANIDAVVQHLDNESLRKLAEFREKQPHVYEAGKREQIIFSLAGHKRAPNDDIARLLISAANRSLLEDIRLHAQRVATADAQIKQMQSDAEAMRKSFIKHSVDKTFKFNLEYEQIRNAYLNKLGAVIRFVPYEQLDKEEPCAGPDTPKPSAKTTAKIAR